MMSTKSPSKSLLNKFELLPESAQNDVLNYLDFLISKHELNFQ